MRALLKVLLLCCCLALTAVPVAAATTPPSLTQRDWMVSLVDTLGYAAGLPDEPQDADYVKLLDGERSYRFEAEALYDPADLVALNNFSTFGAFSGEGWVSALASPTRMRMHFLLPQAGVFRFYAAVRLPGHTLNLDDKTWHIDANHQKFQRVDLGVVTLKAGSKEFTVDLPANGSIDYVEFIAEPLPRIVPLSAWNPDAPLTRDDLAVTVARALGLEALLPLEGETRYVEAEAAPDTQRLATDQRHLGEPHGGMWLRAGAVSTEITLPFPLSEGAAYDLALTAAAEKPLTGRLDARHAWEAIFPTYLREQSIGTWFLAAGEHTLTLHLAPRSGIDLLTLRKRRSSGPDYCLLVGLPPDGAAGPDEANRLLTLLARLR